MHRRLPAILLATTTLVALVGCAAQDATAEPAEAAETSAPSSSDQADWPRTIEHVAGETELDAQPLRIVSTSPSITGSLLAIDAPIIASGAATITALTDENGFFVQWADVAAERGVEVAYGDLTLDIDAIDLLEPDLIIGSANGGDATLDAYDQLSEIAPTIMLDYGTVTWQELTVELGEITGLEIEAAAVLDDYDAWVAEQAELIAVPEQPSTALVYLGADGAWAFGDASPQASLLTSLGFDYVAADVEATTPGATGVDVITSENLPSGLGGSQTLFIVQMGGGDPVSTFVADPLTANLPAVTDDRVYSLGSQSFRLDYYSAKNTVELLVDTFPK